MTAHIGYAYQHGTVSKQASVLLQPAVDPVVGPVAGVVRPVVQGVKSLLACCQELGHMELCHRMRSETADGPSSALSPRF